MLELRSRHGRGLSGTGSGGGGSSLGGADGADRSSVEDVLRFQALMTMLVDPALSRNQTTEDALTRLALRYRAQHTGFSNTIHGSWRDEASFGNP